MRNLVPAGKKSQQAAELGEAKFPVVDVDHSLTILIVFDMAAEHSVVSQDVV